MLYHSASSPFCIRELTDANRQSCYPFQPESMVHFAFLIPGHTWLFHCWDSPLTMSEQNSFLLRHSGSRLKTDAQTVEFYKLF